MEESNPLEKTPNIGSKKSLKLPLALPPSLARQGYNLLRAEYLQIFIKMSDQ